MVAGYLSLNEYNPACKDDAWALGEIKGKQKTPLNQSYMTENNWGWAPCCMYFCGAN